MVLLLGQTRILFAMSRDGLLPRGLRDAAKYGTPVRLTIVGRHRRRPDRRVLPDGDLEEMVNIGTLLAFVLAPIGMIVLRRTRPDLPRGFRVPVVPLVRSSPVPRVPVADGWNLSIDLAAVPRLAGRGSSYFAYGRRHSSAG